ncbi:hypothetical protein [Acinetobacter baumannii]|uniref:hypothetical protein n=1 Tax=Acinetobacter baumannii TaxID=470 RepID=UPI001C0D88CC|nr:hypothetical protein [Acinetobacter baumannii]MBU3169588.1 hypothetical protein [Acinetobacter baumannii]MDV4217626.1 hypothetical protein [Acinetobacter baumannii]MDV7457705.1 hypothetical protein [Acinetobacter baumannii]
MVNDIEKLNRIVTSALTCFENHLPSIVALQTFPLNYCEEVSSILLMILRNENILDFKMMQGSKSNGNQHYWLESETHIIDLTAHQFDSINAPFLLVPKKEYPLRKIFNRNISEAEIHPNWSGLMHLAHNIQEKFYESYYINK